MLTEALTSIKLNIRTPQHVDPDFANNVAYRGSIYGL